MSGIEVFVEGNLITRCIHLFLWQIGSEQHCTCCERQSHHIFSYDQQEVSDRRCLWQPVSSHFFLWPTVCEWHCTLCKRQSHHVFTYDQQLVSYVHYTFCRQSRHILSYNQQLVSDVGYFVKCILSISFPITYREWVTLQMLQNTVSSYLFIWQIASECQQCTFALHLCLWQTVCEQHRRFSGGILITSFLIINSLWVTLQILWKADSSQLIL